MTRSMTSLRLQLVPRAMLEVYYMLQLCDVVELACMCLQIVAQRSTYTDNWH